MRERAAVHQQHHRVDGAQRMSPQGIVGADSSHFLHHHVDGDLGRVELLAVDLVVERGSGDEPKELGFLDRDLC
eukprot:2020400-Heterocapsa_arctica.AAC.1